MAYAFRLLVLFIGLSSLKVWAAPVSGDATYETLHVVGDARTPRSYGNALHEAAYLARQL